MLDRTSRSSTMMSSSESTARLPASQQADNGSNNCEDHGANSTEDGHDGST